MKEEGGGEIEDNFRIFHIPVISYVTEYLDSLKTEFQKNFQNFINTNTWIQKTEIQDTEHMIQDK